VKLAANEITVARLDGSKSFAHALKTFSWRFDRPIESGWFVSAHWLQCVDPDCDGATVQRNDASQHGICLDVATISSDNSNIPV
jgi:hypothetical protein